MHRRIRVSRRYVFSDKSLIAGSGGTFEGQGHTIIWAKEVLTYDGQSRLKTYTNDLGYGQAMSYEPTGTGLDSLYRVLGGLDGHYLMAPQRWDLTSQSGFLPYPCTFLLAVGSQDIEVTMHKSGLIREVQSLPNGEMNPDTQIFSFENVLDEDQRIKQTTIRSDNNTIGVWKLEYSE
ncbi:hypothetical protein [Flavihumibacter petaseus]|uniref:Uncharacterized protein n=1 Tax=Flavihumibacter petaseus NBRC 106054 TaxID=1220578 RepID=A0A0E9N6I8_9BACT|nr:hypothetical protein [Flavihumibacter petaseus]GAO45429.1 hypothetical protein FPE01S_05_01240 [Flavihumibacter petaseus NBRC 106054]